MRQPGGLWWEVWSVAEPVPAHRQKKLFDDTREAEKVLHYLAGLKTAELGLLVLPVLTHCAVHALRERHGIIIHVHQCCAFRNLYFMAIHIGHKKILVWASSSANKITNLNE